MKLKNIGSNQTQVELNGATILFSYQTPVAAVVNGQFYRTQQDFSRTTSKHINAWLAGNPAQSKPQSFFDDLAVVKS